MAATTPAAGLKKRHLPAVGIIGLALVGVAMGSVYYTQFVVPHSATCQLPTIHRVYILTAIIQDIQGFQVQSIYQTNSTMTPLATNSSGVPDVSGANFTKLPSRADPKEIFGNVGDTITLYIKAINTTDFRQYPGITGHGFDFTDKSFLQSFNVTGGTGTASQQTPTVLKFDHWVAITFQIAAPGSAGYFCTQVCSGQHNNMRGTLRAGCG